MKKIHGMFGVEMRAYGQKLVKFCTHTDTQTHASKLVVEMYITGKQLTTQSTCNDIAVCTVRVC